MDVSKPTQLGHISQRDCPACSTLVQPITNLNWDALEQEQEYQEWRRKRDTDVKWCRKVHTQENQHTGTVVITSKDCNEPDCPQCGPRIRDEMTQQLNSILKERPLRIITLTGPVEEQKAQRAKIMRKYGKRKTSVFPSDIITQKDGIQLQTQILVDTKDEIGEEYVTLHADDIYRWSMKSFLSKKSGNLHKKPQVIVRDGGYEEEETDQMVTVECWKLDCRDEDKIRELEKEVLSETRDLDPKTLEELQQALVIRRQVRKRVYAENDIVILSNKSLRVTVKMHNVKWKRPMRE